jgi:H+/Cl- antiporter ClcA
MRRIWSVPGLAARAAAVVSAVVLSLVATAFARGGDIAQTLFRNVFAARPLLTALAVPLVFLGVAWMTRRWFPEARGSGIPQVMAAAHNPQKLGLGPLVSIQTAAAKLVGTLAMLASGATVGREGPTVQIAAAVTVAVHRLFRVPITAGVIIAGGAAGVAAAFNTPLAGVAFAIEELAAAYEQRVAVLVMGLVMVSGLVSLGLNGDYVYFGLVSSSLTARETVLIAPLAGILGGVGGGIFSRAISGLSVSARPLSQWLRARPLTTAVACGAVVAIIGYISHGLTWGTGYDTTRTLLSGGDAPVLYGPLKFVSALATALSGAPGGIFAPALSVGAGLGQLLTDLFPDSAPGAIVLLATTAYFTGVVRSPLTAVIIMMEMTSDRSLILPLFASALVADWASALVCPRKLYHTLSQTFR